jgi:hypothetical protein
LRKLALSLIAVLAFWGIAGLTFRLLRRTGPPRPGWRAPARACADLYAQVCAGGGANHDPTGDVRPDRYGEERARRERRRIVDAHPEWSLAQVNEELVRVIYTPERRGALVTNERWVREHLMNFIDAQPGAVFSREEKRRLRARIDRTELELPPPAAAYADEPELFLQNDVFYERVLSRRLRLRVGGAYLFTGRSRFNQIFTLAHELAHAIDPCEMRVARFSLPAYDRLSACFLERKLVAARRTRSECGRDDQLSETFADWVAVQITAEAIRELAADYTPEQRLSALANSVADLCEQDEDAIADVTYHPSPRIRIDQIFGRNPAIRELLGCTSAAVTVPESDYCDLN